MPEAAIQSPPAISEAVREGFPALAQEVNGHPLVYFDNAATTQKPHAVLEAIRHYYEHDNANVHRGIHELSNRATGAYEGARDRVEEIVVIGRKRARAEELQEVPVSITAFSAEQLQSTVVRDLTDISSLSPSASLQSSSQRGVQNFAIRGTGVSGTTPSDEPAVGVFQDGVYWGSNYGALTELFDVEGVEILRGPQGTLFGRNVTGGAVSLRSARPSAIPYKRLSIGVSNGLGLDASAILSGPVSDTISARLAVMQRANAGLYENIDTGTEYGKSYVTIVRPSVKFEPSDTFDLTLLGEFYSQTGDPTPELA